ncbi:MAG TPA: hypothetical protein VFP36_02390 [Usitatibacter sp.]|nr:hypothetical protein [Usitatibacter sp.]
MLSVLLAALVIGPAFSGSWYDPGHNGEGFTLQVFDNGTALALWYTYPPAASAAQQAWIYASDGVIDGDTIRFPNAYTTRGPRFGTQFDPAAVQLIPWGTIELRFTGCNSGQLTYSGPSAWGSGGYALTRLTALSELECTGKRRLSTTGARLLDGMRSRSGSWYDPAHNGEGWQVEELPDGRTQVYWFTYDARGEQAWTIGVSDTSGSHMAVTRNLRPVGTHFGSGFSSSQITLQDWGRFDLQLDSCLQGSMSYQSTLSDFGSGSLQPKRLSIPAASVCIDGTPARPASITWSTAASMPRAQSEAARAIIGSQSFIAGGFTEPRSFQRFDAATNAWTALPDLPGGRDHPLALAIDGSVYVTGGNPNGAGDQSTSGWRYIVAENRWESVPQLPWSGASGAAVLGGYGWFGSADGSLTQFNPRTRATRVIPGDGRAPRDHSQLVAFEGELWMIGGRGAGETASVSIFDPASETWRAGPSMRVPRAGSAAAASDTLLVVAGGEVVQNGTGVSNVMEAIAAGEPAWSGLSSLPTPVQGASGAINGNAFYVFGGSTAAGSIQNVGTVQVGTFTNNTTSISFAKAAATGAPNSSVDVSIVRTGSTSGTYDVFYTVDGEGCNGSFTAGPVSFGGGDTARTISVPLRGRGTCMVWLVPSEVIGSLRVMSITVVPVVAGCPAPSSDDVVVAQLGGIGNPLIQRQKSGQLMFLELPKLTQGSGGQLVFSESAGAAYTPQPVTLEISISKCPAVISNDTSNVCNVKTTNGSYNSIQWLFKPYGSSVDAASANRNGFCWAGDPATYYVNARWTYTACAFNVETCGFAVQYNLGAN